MKKGKVILAGVLAGLNIGAVKFLHNHRAGVKRDLTKLKQRKDVYTYYIGNAYSKLSASKQKLVIKNLHRIIPKRDSANIRSFNYQLDVNNYMKLLHYLSHRYEFHATHASHMLNIPLIRVQQMTLALIKQGFLEYTEASEKFVRQNKVEHTLKDLDVHYKKGHNVNPLIFNRALRNSIAQNMFD